MEARHAPAADEEAGGSVILTLADIAELAALNLVAMAVGALAGRWIGERLALWLVLRRFRRALLSDSAPAPHTATIPEQFKSYADVTK